MNDFIYTNLNKLKKAKIPNPEIDLRILLNYSSNLSKKIFLSNFIIEDINLNKFNNLIKRRINNEPISKIINKKYFWKDEFYVNKYVLDPRPETEGIIEESINVLNNRNANLKILDIGTGTGAIAISLSREFFNANIIATEISDKAINVARKNIIKNKLNNRIKLFKNLSSSFDNYFDLVVSNPPYLSSKEYRDVGNNIKNFEPKIALIGGLDGLDFYREFAENVPQLMKKNAHLIIEIGEKQFENCLNIFKLSGLKFLKKKQDLQKKDRIMVFSKI